MIRSICLGILFLLWAGLVNSSPAGAQSTTDTEPAVFSGPQKGEAIPGLTMQLGVGDRSGEEIDLVEQAGGKPLALVFVHKRTRPAFALGNAILKYCQQEGGDQLVYGLCFLTEDPTDTRNWMGRVQGYFPAGTPVGLSPAGIEGPGAWGLNRNVELTVVIGKENQVTDNFALVQPGAHVDGPKILQAIARVIGKEGEPDINRYLPNNQNAQDAPLEIDPGLMKAIRQLNARDASAEQVDAALLEIREMIAENEPLQKQLGSVLSRWEQNGRLKQIGSENQQKQLLEWAAQFRPQRNPRAMGRGQGGDRAGDRDPRLTEMLRQLIQKDLTVEGVERAAQAIEQYVAENPAAARQLGEITNRVVGSDRLSNYGTEAAQSYLKAWAEKYRNP